MSSGAGSKLKDEGKNSKPSDADKIASNKEFAGYDAEDIIFALDIGTRTVVGVVGVEETQKLRILAVDVVEHNSRAMIDGQIHDVDQVAKVAGLVKSRLEESTGLSLTKVAIAAAGRVLKTCEVVVERELEQVTDIDRSIVGSLEMEAIQQAQLKLEEDIKSEEKNLYYCVGYSIINYFLNGFAINSLTGHRGRRVGAKVLATFLPHIVVDSLYMVMNRIGLEVVGLTLEPIAAINVTIPKDLRLLNLALVDIGAGTSDIALTREGSVVAYGMVPFAGDEITEKISQYYLVDFNTGERIKTSLTSKKKSISFVDILGKKHSVDLSEIHELIRPVVENLAVTISQKILEFNGKSPNAVFLIGGGSRIPGLPSIIANYLELPEERVAVRGREVIQSIRYKAKRLSGPESITPFGIAVTALIQRGQDFLAVRVNGKKIRIFNSRKLTVADALVIAGFNAELLIGRSGKSVRFELNGEKKLVKGEYGKSAEISVNGKEASIETLIKMDDNIEISPGQKGKDAVVRVRDFVKSYNTGKVTLNHSTEKIGLRVYINDTESEIDSLIAENDIVKIIDVKTIEDLARINEIDLSYFSMLVDGFEAGMDYVLKDGDEITCAVRAEYRDKEDVGQIFMGEEKISANAYEPEIEEPLQEKKESFAQYNEKNAISVNVNGKDVLIKGDKQRYIFVDIFNFIDFDISKPQGSIVLKLNGKPAAFTDIVRSGDNIEIYWDK